MYKTRWSPALQKVPPERLGSLSFGLFNHLVPTLGFCFLAEMTEFSWLSMIIGFLAISLVGMFLLIWAEHKYPCVKLAPISRGQVFKGLSLVFIKGVGAGGLIVISGWMIFHLLFPVSFTFHSQLPTSLHRWMQIIFAVLMTDLVYYLIHRFLNHGRISQSLHRWYRRNHSVHHSVLALDFFRGNISSFFDTAVTGFQIPLILIGALLKMSLASQITAYAITLLLQSTHHVNHTFNIGWFRYIFVDNHTHKLHHCVRGGLVNFAAIFSFWDRLFGTYYENFNLCANYLEKNRIPLPIKVK